MEATLLRARKNTTRYDDSFAQAKNTGPFMDDDGKDDEVDVVVLFVGSLLN